MIPSLIRHLMTHTLRSLWLAPTLALVAHADPATTPPPLKTETLKGMYASARFRPDDWKILKAPKEFMGFLDQIYETMAELTANYPPMELRG